MRERDIDRLHFETRPKRSTIRSPDPFLRWKTRKLTWPQLYSQLPDLRRLECCFTNSNYHVLLQLIFYALHLRLAPAVLNVKNMSRAWSLELSEGYVYVYVCIYIYIQYITIQYNTIRYNTMQYNTIQYIYIYIHM